MGIRVLALIHDDGRPHLRAAVPGSWTLQIVSSAADLVAALSLSGAGNAIVLDPAVVQADALELVLVAAERAGAGVLLYSSLRSRSAERVLEVVTRMPAELVFYGAGDVTILTRLLSQLPFSSVPALLLRRLAPRIKHLSASVRLPVLGLFGWRPIANAFDEAQEGEVMSSSSVWRAVHSAGLGSFARLQVCARLARVSERLLSSHESVEMIADREGFESLRTLEDQFARTIEVPPRQARAALNATEFADRLALSLSR